MDAMKRRNVQIGLILLAAVLALSAGLYFLSRTGGGGAAEDTAVIYVGSTEYRRIPLSRPQIVTIRQEGGQVNVIRVDKDGIQMLEANCSNQHCVKTGQVTRDNWEWKPDGAYIICLPNQVTVELEVKE